MSTAIYDLKVSGFQPETQEMSEIHKMVARIYDMSPSDSYLSLHLDKKDGKYIGAIKVASSHGLFTSKSDSDDLTGLIQASSAEVIEQIQNWKKTRFNEFVG